MTTLSQSSWYTLNERTFNGVLGMSDAKVPASYEIKQNLLDIKTDLDFLAALKTPGSPFQTDYNNLINQAIMKEEDILRLQLKLISEQMREEARRRADLEKALLYDDLQARERLLRNWVEEQTAHPSLPQNPEVLALLASIKVLQDELFGIAKEHQFLLAQQKTAVTQTHALHHAAATQSVNQLANYLAAHNNQLRAPNGAVINFTPQLQNQLVNALIPVATPTLARVGAVPQTLTAVLHDPALTDEKKVEIGNGIATNMATLNGAVAELRFIDTLYSEDTVSSPLEKLRAKKELERNLFAAKLIEQGSNPESARAVANNTISLTPRVNQQTIGAGIVIEMLRDAAIRSLENKYKETEKQQRGELTRLMKITQGYKPAPTNNNQLKR